MSASTPPPPQGSSTGLYVGVAVMLLVGIGFFAWKSCNAPPPPLPTVVTPPPTAPPTSTLKIDDLPLPPPEDAGQPDTGVSTTKFVPQSNPCEAKVCNGKENDELVAALQQRARQAHRCYDEALAQDATLQGKVQLKVKIGANGSICGATVLSDELSNRNVSQCVARAFLRAASVPPPKGGCVEINLPINFKPGGR